MFTSVLKLTVGKIQAVGCGVHFSHKHGEHVDLRL